MPRESGPIQVALALLLGIASLSSPASGVEILTLDPMPGTECEWDASRPFNPVCPSIDTRDARRATLGFDLTNIDVSQILSLTLELVVVQRGFVGWIEAVGLDAFGERIDPFQIATLNPDAGPCTGSTGTASCPVLLLSNPASGDGRYAFLNMSPVFPRQPADVTEALLALDLSSGYLQLNLVPVGNSGAQFGHSGFADTRLAPATLTVVIPEPSSGCLLALGLIGLSVRTRAWGA